MNALTPGTTYLLGPYADRFRQVTTDIMDYLRCQGFQEFVPSALAYQELFKGKARPDQMYGFKDKGDRDLCLIPEVTAVCQSLYKSDWSKRMPKPVKVMYLTRCYRYERPQAGRYREFWQLGVECMGWEDSHAGDAITGLLARALHVVGLEGHAFADNVKRGLGYYTEDGFEVECDWLGAQKQIAGGGRYDCGIGWAIGVERLLMALETRPT